MRSYRRSGPDWMWTALCVLHIVVSIATAMREGWQSGLDYFIRIPTTFLLYAIGGCLILAVGVLGILLYGTVMYGIAEGARWTGGLIKSVLRRLK